jgi:LacI family transcriptional regulator
MTRRAKKTTRARAGAGFARDNRPQMRFRSGMKARVTMRTVAQRAGVHVTTVSLALRNDPRLPLATRERLRALAEQLGYESDPALCRLAAYRTQFRAPQKARPLGYITNWITEWGWKEMRAHARIFEGAAARAPELGYQLEHYWLGARGLTHQRLSDLLHERGISGLILAAHGRKPEHPLELEWRRFTAVKIDFLPRQPALHKVGSDHRAVIQLAVRRAVSAGYRRIGLVLSPWLDASVDFAWSAGFLAEQQTHPSRDHVPILMAPDGGGDPLVPRAPLERWLTLQRPEVVIAEGGCVLPRLAELKIAVPKDIAFIDLQLEPAPDRRLAGVRQNFSRVGELAVELVVAQLHQRAFGTPALPTTTLVDGTWFDGASLPGRSPAEPTASAPARRAAAVSSVRVK